MDGRPTQSQARSRLAGWLSDHAPELLFAGLILLVIFMRDLWAPDEPDFAQCVKEMAQRGSWLFPWMNGAIYTEKPILFYWAMKASNGAMAFLTGGLGFTQGLAAWALRLPSALASLLFLVRFRSWAARFLGPETARLAAMILATTPLWFWQSQFIQIDLLFSALVAWSWLCWLKGYLLDRGFAASRHPGEASRATLAAFVWLGLAFLAKGPLAVVLSGLVVGAFLLWQRDLGALVTRGFGWGVVLLLLVVLPWYVAAGVAGGPGYLYAMVIHQNFERATHAWDHVQPFYQYAVYMLGDFFPWVLLLPALGLHLRRSGAFRDPARRFLVLAFVAPFLFLSAVQSKQGKYLLMSYPFLTLLVAEFMGTLAEGTPMRRIRRLGGLLAAGLAVPTAVLVAVSLGAGSAKLQAQVVPYLGPLHLMAAGLLGGTLCLATLAFRGAGRRLIPVASLSLGFLYLVGGTWGFRSLDPAKSYRRWTVAAEPLIAGRRVYYWQTMRSGVMVYTDHLMPEVRTAKALATLDPEARLVAQRDEWEQNLGGLTPALRAQFDLLLDVPTGGGEILLLRRRPQ